MLHLNSFSTLWNHDASVWLQGEPYNWLERSSLNLELESARPIQERGAKFELGDGPTDAIVNRRAQKRHKHIVHGQGLSTLSLETSTAFFHGPIQPSCRPEHIRIFTKDRRIAKDGVLIQENHRVLLQVKALTTTPNRTITCCTHRM